MNFKDFSYEGQASDIDDHALVIVEYENGVKGQLHSTCLARSFTKASLSAGTVAHFGQKNRRALSPDEVLLQDHG